MARTYADVNASLGRAWYDYGQYQHSTVTPTDLTGADREFQH